ncbi:PDR/VanB family oxidoreductase [Microbacterium sp.]|uniref:PDR/VanB family oxidoreductase n=1 Tax=Microbacterium sp. TaxID=51671 RepID=UPI002633463F|nr:PDR/VanB family oxidoreductase [Microbacterium sp.]
MAIVEDAVRKEANVVSVEETTIPVVVASKHMDGDSVAVLTLRRPDGNPFPAWTPGAHIDVIVTPALTRQYSLCGDPADQDVWQIAVLREPPPRGRGGSQYIHDSLELGAQIQVRGPRNHFALKDAEQYLFIAGGIGITPLKPMIDQVAAAGAKWNLVYGGRSLSTMALRADLARYGDHVTYVPEDELGRIDLDSLLGAPVEGALVYCCGPGPLLDAVENKCSVWWPGSLQPERFTPRDSDRSAHNEVFEVELAQSGLTLTVPPHKSILEILEDNGIPVLSSCRSGVCGTCETDVLEGTPEHRDSFLTAEERESNATMMVCVSRCAGRRLLLDV